MHTFLTTLLCLLGISHLSAQGISWIHGTENYTDGANIVATNPGEWVVTGKSGYGGGFVLTRPFIGSYIDDLWTDFNITDQVDYFGELSNISHLTYDSSIDQFYFVLGQEVCDVTLANLLISTGVNGTWFKEINGSFTESYPVCAVPGNGVIWGKDTRLAWQRTADEETDFSSVLTGEEVKGLQFWRDGYFLLQTSAQLYAYSFDIAEATLNNTYTGITDVLAFSVLNEERVVLVEEDRILLLDENLNVVSSTTLEGAGTKHLASDATGIYLLRDLPQDGMHAIFLDYDLNETGRTALNMPDYEIGDIAAQGGRIAITGAHQFAPLVWGFEPTNSQLFLRTYTATGPDLDPQHDLAVESITFDDTHFYTPEFWSCNNGEIDGLQVTIRNNGDTPIKDVLLKFDTDICNGICDGYLTRTFLHEDVNLAPNQSITLPFFETLNLFGLIGDELELCINATVPGQAMETTLNNNSVCETIIVVNTDDALSQETALHVFPNPVQDVLSVEIPAETESIYIYDSLGQLIRQKSTLDIQGRYDMDVHGLPSGVYFIRISGQQKIYTGSFVRQ